LFVRPSGMEFSDSSPSKLYSSISNLILSFKIFLSIYNCFSSVILFRDALAFIFVPSIAIWLILIKPYFLTIKMVY
jgi:hypothetical protein